MKIRTGFVSNSSSSSFLAFVNKSAYDRVFNLIKNDEIKEYLKDLVHEDSSYENYLDVCDICYDDYESDDSPQRCYNELTEGLTEDKVMIYEYSEHGYGGVYEAFNKTNSPLLMFLLSFMDKSEYHVYEEY